MNSQNYIIIAVVAILGIIGFAVWSNRSQGATEPLIQEQPSQPPSAQANPSPENSPSSVVEVNYDGTSFSPSPITIKKGATVRFVNKSSSPMWVASNPHPVHTDYPGFDQKQRGDSYEFTFDKTGTWGYHNHLEPSITGQIIVTD